MDQKRQLRKTGDVITLGGTDYRLESVEGCGGSSVVYRAKYEDRLNRGCYHNVLIKELFPAHPQGLIYRDEAGSVCCQKDGELYMERCRQSFYRGNQANLELLDLQPEQISGNLNSFQAYGTYYSVLAVHGGKNLEQLLEEGTEVNSLRAAAAGMIKILNALECFHKNGILHLDISPDNILMLEDRALLIDYNSVWPMEQMDGEIRLFSIKDGYSAPEVRLRQEVSIGPATDLYSAAAVFFRILTGRRLTDDEIVGSKLGKCFPKDLQIFRDQPVSAAKKAVQIVSKGLNILPRQRYQSIGKMRGDFEELIRRIDGKGISHSAIWETSRRGFREKARRDGLYLDRTAKAETGELMTQDACYEKLKSGGLYLLKGPGGMGKTCFLQELWARGVRDYQSRMPVTVYIPLTDYQEAGEEPFYIRKYLLRRLCFSQQARDMEEALHILDRLFDKQNADGRVSFILLLDGLNEAGTRAKGLLKEIEDLGRKPGLGILVTDRWDSVKQYGLHEFFTLELQPLSEQAVAKELERDKIPMPKQEDLAGLLGNPMMLYLYRETVKVNLESGRGLEDAGQICSMEEMTGRYLESLCVRGQRLEAGNQAEQLRQNYLIRHLLPEIAGELKRRKKTLVTLEELYQIVRKNYKSLNLKRFGMAFPEYMGKSRLMFREIANEQEWFDYAVSEQLISHLNLLEKTADGNYGLIHDNFTDYLAGVWEENKKKVGRYLRKTWGLKGCAVILLAVVLAAGGAAAWKSQAPVKLSEEDQLVIRNAVSRLVMNLQILDIQAGGQKMILQKAGTDQVLDGEPEAAAELKQLIEKKSRELPNYDVMVNDGRELLNELELMKTEIPISELGDLYAKPGEMGAMIPGILEHLEYGLCSEESPYYDRSKREPLVNAYQEYLDAYMEVCYLELSRVLLSLEQETADTVLDSVQEMMVFPEFILNHPLSGQSSGELAVQLEAAKGQLKDKRDEMVMQNYEINR
ncbi:MAG: NACHT domain-containing protein [Clostridiaceae bacterium]|nr:NACHT domain-containing protein [Clostridiaceae bacterium]